MLKFVYPILFFSVIHEYFPFMIYLLYLVVLRFFIIFMVIPILPE